MKIKNLTICAITFAAVLAFALTAPVSNYAQAKEGGRQINMESTVGNAVAGKHCPGLTTALTDAEIDEILRIHNAARAAVGTPMLTWNCTLARFAQSWANKDEFDHSPDSERENIIKDSFVGENLSAEANQTVGIAQLLKGWADEEPFWNNAAKTCKTGEVCGHYTQMVWRETTEIGCGINRKSSAMGDEWIGKATYLVCSYNPGGNNGDEAF